jgi:16S rRNA (uracil1498-N3)-methyltransferase
MHRFYAPPKNISGDMVMLDESETRHAREVLRMRAGSVVNVFDGEGREYSCEITGIGKKECALRIVKEIEPTSPESPLDLTLAAAILKGEKFDWLIQKAVELGVTRLIPITTIRCDVKMDGPSKRLDRWRRIALEATKQCGRARIMDVAEALAFKSFIAQVQDAHFSTFLFSERGGSTFSSDVDTKSVVALVGSEGGWDDSELEQAKRAEIQIVTLGGRVLRAETAGIAVTALLQNKFGDLN